MAAALSRQKGLTKPPGALGVLEDLSVRLAGMTGSPHPRFARVVVVVAAASHGVAEHEPVSAYPSSVTGQMVANFVAGGAAINVLSRVAGAELVLVDAGVAPDPGRHPRVRRARLSAGTRNFLREPAMPRDHATRIVEAGVALAAEMARTGPLLLALGEMGIGNTTAASAVAAAMTGRSPDETTGRGTMVDDERFARKRAVVAEALRRHAPDASDPVGVLAAVGGHEIGFLAGCCLGAAAFRVPVVLDGFVTGAAALLAVALAPGAASYLIASHRSAEKGHDIVLRHLGLTPLLDLQLRLGEGTGAALALPIICGAVRTLNEMATFGDAGVDTRLPRLGRVMGTTEWRDGPRQRIVVNTRRRKVPVPLSEIDWIESADNYARLFTTAGEHLVRETLAGLEDRLGRDRFVRVHRRAIVNIEAVAEVGTDQGRWAVHLRNGQSVPVGRMHRDRLLQVLKR
jgi:nicotinate-nucleotide--dimethylbenzimidazole phosphoribosyltransferase